MVELFGRGRYFSKVALLTAFLDLGLLFAEELVHSPYEGMPDQNLLSVKFEAIKKASQLTNSDDLEVGDFLPVLNHPEVSNWATRKGVQPLLPTHPELGRSLKVVVWNIEKSLAVKDKIALGFKDKSEFLKQLDPKATPEQKMKALAQWQEIQEADVIIGLEQDVGVPRSGYIHSGREIAQALGMNYAYGPSQVEVDPVLVDESNVKPEEYKGLFGTVVWSRFPIKNASLRQLDTQVYDWITSEAKPKTMVENSRRAAADFLLGEKSFRELKVGGRSFFVVDLHVPGLPEGHDTLSVVAVHLEIKAQPKDREAQMKEILDKIRHIKNPVIIAGDFNVAQGDISPTSLLRITKRYGSDPDNFISFVNSGLKALGYAADSTGVISALNMGRKVVNGARNFHRPTAVDIPFVLPNNRAGLFEALREMKFADGSCIDFRGDEGRSLIGDKVREPLREPWQRGSGVGRSPLIPAQGPQSVPTNKDLGNSVQYRSSVRMQPTFSTDKTYWGLGEERLDFIFVKSGLVDDCKRQQRFPYQFAPHFGQNFDELNEVWSRVSDHSPIKIDLPMEEPHKLNAKIQGMRPKKNTVADWWKQKRANSENQKQSAH